MKGYFSIEITI